MKHLAAALLMGFSVLAIGQNDPVASYDPLEITLDASFNQDLTVQQNFRERAQWQAFSIENPSWNAYFNSATGMPHRAFGSPILSNGATPEECALNFADSHLQSFNMDLAQLEILSSNSSGKYDHVNLKQTFEGLDVLSSRIVFKLYGSNIVMFGMDYYSGIDVNTNPSIALEQAENFAIAEMINEIVEVESQSDLKILPLPGLAQTSYHLVYEVLVKTISPSGIPANYQTFVDAHTGEILYRSNLVKHIESCPKCKDKKKVLTMGMATVEGSVKGELYPTSLLNPSENMGLPHLAMTIDGSSVFTDADGNFTTSLNSDVPASLSLEGLYTAVNTGGVVPAFNTMLVDGENSVSFTSEANIKELSTYRAVNLIHDHMKLWLPDFDGLDYAMTANIDVDGTCNAFYDGTINFYDIGGGCNATSLLADVVYHEYGHGINAIYYADAGYDFNNGAMHEGYADFWAISLSNNPHLGQGFFTDTEDGIRRYDIDPKVYPEDLVGESHADGEIICGAWYDSHLLMGEDWDVTMAIFAEAFDGFQAVGMNGNEGEIFVDILLDALQADDDDGDITNGTPHALEIIEGFDIHGINLLAGADIQHEELFANAADEDILIGAEINLEFPFNLFLDGARLYYRINTGAWNESELVNIDEDNYEATIPSQDAGTVISYYMGLMDTEGNLAGVIPSRANIADPALPYHILVGVELVAEHDSDSNEDFGQWETGVNGDDATAGVWELNIPIGTFGNSNDPSTMVAPDHQHTPGIDGEFCFITGQSPSPDASIFDTDVDDGFTTLRSPVIDLSDYEAPVLSYWRWFAHAPVTTPPNIGWIVQVSDDGGSNWTDVESTATDDRAWRRNAIRIEDYVSVNDEFRIQMIASDPIYVGSGAMVEAAADDIYIWDLATGVGIDDQQLTSDLIAYPNPATDQVTIEFTGALSGPANIQMIDSRGRQALVQQVSVSEGQAQQITLDVSELSVGLYDLSISFRGAGSMQQRIIVRR